MKKILFVIAAILSLSLVACSDDDTAVVPEISIVEADTIINATGGEGTILVKTNIANISATSSADFITISESYLSDDNKYFNVVYQAETNPTNAQRKAIITISAGQFTLPVEITQSSGYCSVIEEESLVNFNAVASTGYLTLDTTGKGISAEVNYQEESADWCTITSQNEDKVEFCITENQSVATRTCTIKVTIGQNISQEARITQTGMTLEVVADQSKTAYAVEGEEGTIVVSTLATEIAAEIQYDMSSDDEPNDNTPTTRTNEAAGGWITINSATVEDGVSITIAPNETGVSRNAKIIITAGECVEEVVVNQSGAEFEINGDTNSFDATGGEATIGVSTNAVGQIEATTDADWVEVSVNEKTVTFTVAQYNGKDERKATITVKTGEVVKHFEISQAGVTVSAIEVSAAEFNSKGGSGVITFTTTASEVAGLVKTESAEWITFSEAEADTDTKGRYSISYTVPKYALGTAREAQIAIKAGEVESEPVTIKQRGLYLTIGDIEQFGPSAGQTSFTIDTDAEAVTITKAVDDTSTEWLTIGEYDTHSATISVTEYLDERPRSADIIIKAADDLEVTKTITQTSVTLSISDELVSLAHTAASAEVAYTSNVADIVPTATISEGADWLTAVVENGAVKLSATDNILIEREAAVTVKLGWNEVVIPVKQAADNVVLFDKMVVNAPASATSSLVTINALDNLVSAGVEWTVESTESWLTATKQENSIVLSNEAFNDTWEIRNAKVNVMMDDKVLRTIEVYQMDKYALRGCWQFIDKNGNECEYVSLRRHEHIPRGTKSDADYPYTLEIHDLKFKSFNQQPWVSITVGDNSEPGVIFSYQMPYIQGWNNNVEFRMVPCNSLPWNEGFQCWGINTNTGDFTIDSHSLAFTFTYAVEEDGSEVLLIGQNDAMKAHPDADKMTGFSWVQFNKTNGKISGPMAGAGIYGNGNIAKLKRTFRPAKDDLRLTNIPGNNIVNASNEIYSDRYDDIQWF